MGYCATGSGYINLKEKADRDEVNRILLDSTLDYSMSKNSPYIDIYQYDKYCEDCIQDALKEIVPYVEDIQIDFCGEDGCLWCIYMKDGEVVEESYEPVLYNDLQKLTRCKAALIKALKDCADSYFETNGAGVSVLRYIRSLGLTDEDIKTLGFDWLFDLEENEDAEAAQAEDISVLLTPDIYTL